MLSTRCSDPSQLEVYQDMVVAGQTVVAGARDCQSRWEILSPWMPRQGSVLDIGSNLGWFGLKICGSFPDCVVASVEPDDRTGPLQRQVLASHQSDRICLLTERASARLAARFARAGQRFDAVLCLSVLHWLPQHRPLLETLGPITRRFLVEHPDPRESGAGFEAVRREIGAIGPYLKSLFPDRPITRLAQLPSHRDREFPREIWLVDERPGMDQAVSPGLEVSALMRLSPAWPPRSWWQSQHASLESPRRQVNFVFSPRGLQISEETAGKKGSLAWRFRFARLPEHRCLTLNQWLYRRARRWTGRVVRRLQPVAPTFHHEDP